MAKYDTRALTVGDLTVTVSKAGKSAAEKIVAFLEALADRIDADYGKPEGGHPDQGLPPGQGRPDQGLPPAAGRPDQGLPEGGTKPTPPGQGGVGRPDQGLPGDQPEAGQLPAFIRENAEEIAKAILKGTLCDPDKEPK